MKPLQVLSQREYERARARFFSDPHNQSHSQARSVDPSLVAHYSVEDGLQQPDSNRYADICPYDRNRVSSSSRYLNASWVLERYGGKWWIATQAPLPTTSHAFLSMLMDPVTTPSNHPPSHARTVVQLTRYIESGMTKADPYFPSTRGDTIEVLPERGSSLPPLRVTLDAVEWIADASCTKSTVSVRSGSEKPYTFCHLLYTAWPDHGIPSDENRQTLLSLLHLAESTNKSLSSGDPPIVVGCSAGVGRTGTFIALSSLLRAHNVLLAADSPTPPDVLPASKLGPVPTEDAVVQEVDFLREQRPCMVQRNEQVTLIYEMLNSALSK